RRPRSARRRHPPRRLRRRPPAPRPGRRREQRRTRPLESLLSQQTLRLLACPRDQRPLIPSEPSTRLGTSAAPTCSEGHRYPIIEGIPILLRDDVAHTHWAANLSLESARQGSALDNWAAAPPAEGVHPFVQESIGGTGGNLYRSLIGRLPKYPIPDIPLEEG